MADRGVEYGIQITADGKVAIAESAKVEKALDGVAQALDHVEASATQAQPAPASPAPQANNGGLFGGVYSGASIYCAADDSGRRDAGGCRR